jgi:hypothetical protein
LIVTELVVKSEGVREACAEGNVSEPHAIDKETPAIMAKNALFVTLLSAVID